MKKKIIVISAVNLVEGGTLTILRECVASLSRSRFSKEYNIVVLVHKCDLLPNYENIIYVEYPRAKKNYLYRCYYEYIGFKKLSKGLSPELWLSLHDMSPIVKTKRQAVYMHNPSPFYKASLWVVIHSFKYALFSWFYKYVYKINIHANNYLIVQQQWLRDEFSKMFSFPMDKIIVAPPRVFSLKTKAIDGEVQGLKCVFFYPAFPRAFKNFEIICQASRLLNERGIANFEVILTIDGSENGYSQRVVKEYKDVRSIHFVGLLQREKVIEYYERSNCLIFPSLLETWGLPITEYVQYHKHMIIADLPYAHETAAGADNVVFFNPYDEVELSQYMEQVIESNFNKFHHVPDVNLLPPAVFSWEALFSLLLT